MEIERWKWVLYARHLFVWEKDTLANYVRLLQEVVYDIMKERKYPQEDLRHLGSPEIGFLNLVDEQVAENPPLVGYALYIAEVRLSHDKRRTLFSEFKNRYQLRIRGYELIGVSEEDWFKKFPERVGLATNFMTIANKSISHHRAISKRLRYQVFQRDNFTCQSCGRKAPNVILHVDHIEPVSWDLESWQADDLRVSDSLDNYQTLCEDCNLGKGNLPWLLVRS